MKMNFRDDLALKIVSVLIAIGLWFYVVQVQSPDIERTIKGVPVVFSQKSVLENRGLILLNDKEHTIDIKIRGKRKYAIGATAENTTVLADVSSIEGTGTHTVYTNIVLPYANLEIINQHPSALTVEVDNLVTTEKEIEVQTQGEPKNGFSAGTVTVAPSTVTLKGPKSILDGVSTVVAEVDIGGKDADVETIVPLKIYGSNEKEIKSAYITSDITEAEVRCEILKTKLVDVKPVLAGSDPDVDNGIRLDAGSLKQIRVAGPKDLIDSLTSVETQPILIEDINENGEATAELNLPAGVRSLEGNSFTFRFVRQDALLPTPPPAP